ncbi:DUF805 domain-containing protein [Thiosocius teredinicola]|uniref:DUF805 domain-containing protein n=1 Tax=Thiosocius teredinicola TaxID=1973002 RepID=UPI000990F41B
MKRSWLEYLWTNHGRVSRKSFAAFQLVFLPLWFGAIWSAIVVFEGKPPVKMVALAALVLVPLFFANINIWVKRLHDRNYSGLALLSSIIPVAGILWLVIQGFVLRGQGSGNRFGAPGSGEGYAPNK